MKPSLMQAPPLAQLFSQKLIQSAHLKKLQSLKNYRKTQLGVDKIRNNQLQSIKFHKARSFANNYNQEHQQITKRNIQLVSKLQKVKPKILQHSRSNRNNLNTSILSNKSRISLKQKIKEQQTAKQNLRLFVKLKKISSNINSHKILQQTSKTERIKQRIMRYSTDMSNSRKVELKSQKYIHIKPTYLADVSARVKLTNRSLDLKPKSTAQFYLKQDILKNKIQGIERYHSSMNKNLKSSKSNIENEQSAFLTIQPQKQRLSEHKNPRFFKVKTQILERKKVISTTIDSKQAFKLDKKQHESEQVKKLTTNKLIDRSKIKSIKI